VKGQEKLFKFTLSLRRAPYEIGEEIRGRLLKILVTQRKKNGRTCALLRYEAFIRSTTFSPYLLQTQS
jgi:hypothetical protein